MTKKHFEALAYVIRTADMGEDGKQEPRRMMLADRIADICAEANPNFDRGIFLKAAMA